VKNRYEIEHPKSSLDVFVAEEKKKQKQTEREEKKRFKKKILGFEFFG
jgi:hypothetical protein